MHPNIGDEMSVQKWRVEITPMEDPNQFFNEEWFEVQEERLLAVKNDVNGMGKIMWPSIERMIQKYGSMRLWIENRIEYPIKMLKLTVKDRLCGEIDFWLQNIDDDDDEYNVGTEEEQKDVLLKARQLLHDYKTEEALSVLYDGMLKYSCPFPIQFDDLRWVDVEFFEVATGKSMKGEAHWNLMSTT